MFLKGKNLIKLNNCHQCHNIFKNYLNFKIFNFYPKIKNQHKSYLFWSLKQYKNKFSRNNILMFSQIQNLSLSSIKDLIFFINNFF